MYTKASLMALCAAATVKEVVGAHGHRHMHADKRELAWAATETVVVTDYFTVTVTDTEASTATAVPDSANGHQLGYVPSSQSSATAITTPSIESSTFVAPPTVSPTTLVTNVKSTPSSSSQDLPAVSTPAENPVATTPVSTPVETTPEVETPTTTIASTTSIASAKFTPVVPKPIAPSPVGTSGSGAKRGLAYNDASLVQEYLNLGGKASWCYNWGTWPGTLPSGMTYYPMLWSPAPEHSNGWDASAKDAISKGADALLGFNEPDIASQANMSPQAAAAGHIQMMNPYAGQARISSPAISSSENANQGVDWLRQFFNACNGQCQVDFCVAHWYGPGDVSGANLFLQHLKDVHTACNNKPIWVTEFAAQSGSIDTFMSTVITALESSDYSFVEKYSYFMTGVGELFSSPTQLSSYGNIYATM